MYLGVHLIGSLRWNKNIDAPKNNGSSSEVKIKDYHAYLRPRIEYASCVWHTFIPDSRWSSVRQTDSIIIQVTPKRISNGQLKKSLKWKKFPTKSIFVLQTPFKFQTCMICVCSSNNTFHKKWMLVLGPHSKDRKSTKDKQNMGKAEVNKGCAPLTADCASSDCSKFTWTISTITSTGGLSYFDIFTQRMGS